MGRPLRDTTTVPPRSKWNEHAAFLRRSLGGREKWLKRKLERSIESLIVSSGSCASKDDECFKVAIEFYNFLLSSNGLEPRTIEGCIVSGEVKVDESSGLEVVSSAAFGESEGEDELSLASKESFERLELEESLSETEDNNKAVTSCAVCHFRGDTFVFCVSCPLVFHLECLRPILREDPAGDWSCSYCVVKQCRGFKSQLKIRRRARDGIRAMKKLSEWKVSQQHHLDVSESSGSEEFEDMQPLIAYIPEKLKCQVEVERKVMESKEEKPKVKCELKCDHASKEDIVEVKCEHGSKKRKKLDSLPPSTPEAKNHKASIITDSLTSKDIDVDAPRSTGRVRKQPTLYDPQTCAASVWQSDFQVEKALRGDLETSQDDGTSSSADDEEPVENSKEEDELSVINDESDASTALVNAPKKILGDNAVWCDFCRDDRSISVCCFCACRVCFSKHDEKKLLLCDNCDAEYHIYCLTPRLKEVPKDKWYCPECRDSIANSKSSTNTKEEKQKNNESKQSLDFKKLLLKSKKGSVVIRVQTKLLSEKRSIMDPSTHVHVFVKSNRDAKKREKDVIPIPIEVKSNRDTKKREKDVIPVQVESQDAPPLPLHSLDSNTVKSSSTETTVELTVKKKEESQPSVSLTATHLSRKIPRKSKHIPTEKISKTLKDIPSQKDTRSKSKDSNLVNDHKLETTLSQKNPIVYQSLRVKEKKSRKNLITNQSLQDKERKSRKNPIINQLLQVKEKIPLKNPIINRSSQDKEKIPLKNPIINRSPEIKEKKVINIQKEVALPLKSIKIGDTHINCNTASDKVSLSTVTSTAKAEELKRPDKSIVAATTTPSKEDAPLKKPAQESNFVPASPIRGKQGEHSIVHSTSHAKDKESTINLDIQQDEDAEIIQDKKPNVLKNNESKEQLVQNEITTSSSTSIAVKPPCQSQPKNLNPCVTETTSSTNTMQPTKPTVTEIVPARVESANTASLEAMKESLAILSSSVHVPITDSSNTAFAEATDAARAKNTFPSTDGGMASASTPTKVPRRKPGARECMQISRRFGANVIPQKYMDILSDYCTRGKVEHLIRMRERLDDHSRMLESQLAGLECLVKEKGEIDFSATSSTTTTSGNGDSKPPPPSSSA